MASIPIRFYLDENLSPEIVNQLARHGIDAIRGPLETDDRVHLRRASKLGRVVCTRDNDFPRLHAKGGDHAGIVKGLDHHTVGNWVNYLVFLHAICSAEDMRNKLEYLFEVD